MMGIAIPMTSGTLTVPNGVETGTLVLGPYRDGTWLGGLMITFDPQAPPGRIVASIGITQQPANDPTFLHQGANVPLPAGASQCVLPFCQQFTSGYLYVVIEIDVGGVNPGSDMLFGVSVDLFQPASGRAPKTPLRRSGQKGDALVPTVRVDA